MSSLQCLRELIRDRLTAAAEEIFTAVQSTIAGYQEELEDQRNPHVAATSSRGDLRSLIGDRLNAAAAEILRVSEKTVFVYVEALERHRRMLDMVWNPRVKLHRIDLPQQPDCEEEVLPDQESSSSLDSTHIKEDPEEISISPEEKPCLLCPSCPEAGEQHQFEGVPEEVPPEQPERSIRVKQEEPEHPNMKEEEEEVRIKEEEPDDITAVTVKREEDEVSPLSPPDQQQLQVKTPNLEQEETGSCDFKVKKEADVFAVKSEGNKRYSCSECGKKFKHKHYLMKHKIIHTGEKPFSCSQCDKRFARKCYLRIHEVIHSGEKPFSCSQCDKRFARRSVLRTHELNHSGEKPFSCSQCDKRFARKSNLRQHEQIHSGEKPLSCSQCDKRFVLKSNLRRHEQLHSGEKPFSCSQCGKRFAEKGHLRRHEMIHTVRNP